MPKQKYYSSEADLCRDFIAAVERCHQARRGDWIAYAETAGFDILLVRKSDGVQIGVEAKLRLNVEVLSQALQRWRYEAGSTGPDYRAVLVPADATGALGGICDALGITVIRQSPAGNYRRSPEFHPYLPESFAGLYSDWHPWCPVQRHKVPDYIPDVTAGASGPVKLTDWKVKAIKLAIVLEGRPVTRADFKVLGLDPSRWLDRHHGWLMPTPSGYIRSRTMPDFRTMHPRNYSEIEADRAKWEPPAIPTPPAHLALAATTKPKRSRKPKAAAEQKKAA